MLESDTINIIGGGIAGLTTALTFQKLNIKYRLFEQNTDIAYDNVGLGISANVFPILDDLGILEQTKKLGTIIHTLCFVDKNLKYIKSFKLSSPALSVNRNSFYQLIKEHLEHVNIHLNCTKTHNDFSENEIVISADGINSRGRQSIYPNLQIRNSNQVLWRGISKIKLDNKFKNTYHDFVGNNLRFAIIHTGENYYSWYAVKEIKKDKEITTSKDYLKTIFSNYHPIVNEVIDHSENVYFSELKDINPQRRRNLNWFTKKALLIGDAIHPTTPNMANGACLAMEDAYLLANLLKDEDSSLEEIFKNFQNQRAKKVDIIVCQSWYFGRLMHQRSKILDYVVKLGMIITPKFLFDKIYSVVLTPIDINIISKNNPK
jgi:salicylate hydroxylase